MKGLKESRTSPRYIYIDSNGELTKDALKTKEDFFNVLKEFQLEQIGEEEVENLNGLKRRYTAWHYPYDDVDGSPKFIKFVFPGLDGNDCQMFVFEGTYGDVIFAGKPIAIYEITNGIRELENDLVDLFDNFILNPYTKEQADPKYLPNRKSTNLFKRGDFDEWEEEGEAYLASKEYPLDESEISQVPNDPWKIRKGMKWVGKEGWCKVIEVIEPTDHEEPYPMFEVEIFDKDFIETHRDVFDISSIDSYVRRTRAKRTI